MTPQDLVAQFHDATGLPRRAWPIEVTKAERDLRQRLIAEESKEAIDAMEEGVPEHIAQELADMVYVVYGAALTYGIDLDAAVAEVHRANMSKVGLNGAFEVREDGKVLKGPNYLPPDMGFVLEAQRRRVQALPPVPIAEELTGGSGSLDSDLDWRSRAFR